MTDSGYFTEDNSAEVVARRIADTTDPRFKKIMTVLIHHLHAAVKEIEPSQEEWFKAIQFLTATGHMCDDWRQEFIVLSDVSGVCHSFSLPKQASRRLFYIRSAVDHLLLATADGLRQNMPESGGYLRHFKGPD